MTARPNLRPLVNLLNELPATRVVSASDEMGGEADEIAELIGAETGETPPEPKGWWVKLELDIHDHMAWHVVQELGFVLNYISLDERLPTVFMPVSPPPYMNGGPEPFLSWVIESIGPDVDPAYITEVLAGRLPNPPRDLAQWAGCENDACPVPNPD